MTTAKKRDGQPEKRAEKKDTDGPDLDRDRFNCFLLTLLYTMQGLPFGLLSSVPIVLQSNKEHVSYKDQAVFSLIMLPYTLKLSWAPLVDAIYIPKIGRRKSWLVPVQFIIGSWFVYIGNEIDDMLPETGKPNIVKLVYVFFVTIFMVATQDIVVDGWALTMLKKNNVGYASTCNTIGLAIGSLMGTVSSSLLTSGEFCNKYLRTTDDTGGIVTRKNLLIAWGIMFMSVTTFIAIFKKERDCTGDNDHVELSVSQNYSLLWKIFKLPNMRILAVVFLTVKVGFAAADAVTPLKLVDAGVSKNDLMLINTAMQVVKMILPLFVAKYTTGPRPMSVYLKATLIKLVWNVALVVLIYITPKMISNNGDDGIPPLYYYAILVFVLLVQEILTYTILIAALAFFSRISDARFGGTYMTFLNTLQNLGATWSHLVVLGAVDFLTLKQCSLDSMHCTTQDQQDDCKAKGGVCEVSINGYYVEMVLCTFIGMLWYDMFKKVVENLQTKRAAEWLVVDADRPNAKKANNIKTVFSIT